MNVEKRAVRIQLFRFDTAPMRAFHVSWLAFFTSFFGWFAIAPLMAVVRDDLGLSDADVANGVVASAVAAIAARLIVGPMCDRFGPRRTNGWLLVLGALPVMALGLVQDPWTLLWLRLAVGAIGASFIVTQYHTAVMFAPNCVGTAAATTAGWGNFGGGAAQFAMPLVFAGLVAVGASDSAAWRLAMLAPGAALILMGLAYFRLTQDTPAGDQPAGSSRSLWHGTTEAARSLATAARDVRVVALALLYGASFGVQLTMTNIAAVFYHDQFALDLSTAGFLAGLFGLTNLFARTLGGYWSDRVATRGGVESRVRLLIGLVMFEGIALVLLSRATSLATAVGAMALVGLLVQMASGASFAVVPFVGGQTLGAVAGIVGAGGNVGAVAAGLAFRLAGVSANQAFVMVGMAVCTAAAATLWVSFTAPAPVLAGPPAHAQPVTTSAQA